MKIQAMAICVTALALLGSAQGFSQREGVGRAVVTLLPKQAGGAPMSVSAKDLIIKLNGRPATVTSWKPLQGPENSLELVLLIDGSARSSLATQYEAITHFVNTLPTNTKVAIAFMALGQAVFSGPLTADHAQALKGLHLPAGSIGSSASPYFCLSDLAKHWPSGDRSARREVLLVTDGVDPYNLRYDPDNPYLQTAISDSVHAGIVVYAIYWQNKGLLSSTNYENNAGQNLLLAVIQATGGKSFWEGLGNPVSFDPYLDEFARRLQNQYELDFAAPLKGKADVNSFKLNLKIPGTEVDAPQQVLVSPIGPA